MKKHQDAFDLDFSQQNRDFTDRKMEADKETSIFPEKSSIRIWYNEQDADFLPHWHNAIEIIIPIENYYDVEVDQESFHLMPGDILFIPPRKMHYLHAPKTGSRFICLFDVDFFPMIRGYSGMQQVVESLILLTPDTHAPIYSEVYDLFNQIWSEYFQYTEFYEFSIYSNLFRIYTLISRYQLGQIHLFTDSNPAKRKEYFSKLNGVLEYIDEHFTEDLTLDDAADFSGFSKFHFSRLFKEYMNCTFYDYLVSRRIKAAEFYLTNQEMSITDVALQSGFSSISTFNRTFKMKKGCTPGEYRSMFTDRRQNIRPKFHEA
ncbi:MAG: AraC family transcriptional regulator [Lachnospiraceae bacterium]|nr:AraC family transcriptional regulator [Lachnospiraceae bacterium]